MWILGHNNTERNAKEDGLAKDTGNNEQSGMTL